MKILKNFAFIVLLILPIVVSAETVKDGDTVYVLEERKIDCLSKSAYPVIADYDGNLVFTDEENYLKVNEKNECIKLTEEEIKAIDDMPYGSLPYYIDVDENGKYFVYISESNYDVEGLIPTSDTEVGNKYYYMLNETKDEVVGVSSPVKEDLSKYYEIELLASASDKEFNESLTYYVKVNDLLEIYEKVDNPKAEEKDKYYYHPEKPYTEIPFDVLNQDAIKKLKEEYEYVTDVIRLTENEFIIRAKQYAVEGKYLYDVYKANGEKIDFLSGVRRINKLANGLIVVMKDDVIEFYNSSLKKLFTIESDNVDENNPSKRNFINDYGYNNYVQFLTKSDIITEELTHYTIRDYKIITGENQTYKDGDLTFKFSGLLEKVAAVKVNNEEISKDNYTLASGSTIVTLKTSYLNTLKTGTHTLKVEYNDGGYSEAEFKIEETKDTEDTTIKPTDTSRPTTSITTPETYDGITSAVIIASISLIGLLFGIVFYKKNKE